MCVNDEITGQAPNFLIWEDQDEDQEGHVIQSDINLLMTFSIYAAVFPHNSPPSIRIIIANSETQNWKTWQTSPLYSKEM